MSLLQKSPLALALAGLLLPCAAKAALSVSPLQATVGGEVTFTVSGGAPATMVIDLAGEECFNTRKPAPNQVTCRVTQPGQNTITVKDKPGAQGGKAIAKASFTAVAKAAAPVAPPTPAPRPAIPTPPPPPVLQAQIRSAQPVGALNLNQPATFNVVGNNLTTGIRMSLTNCDGGSLQVVNAELIRYSCTPRAAGSQRLFWKQPGSEQSIDIALFNVAQPSAAAPVAPPTPAPRPASPTPPPPVAQAQIRSAQPVGALSLNQPATFNVVGSNLTTGIRMSLTNCDGGSLQVVNAELIRYSCTPRAAGSQRLFWKQPGSEQSIDIAQFVITAPPVQPPPQAIPGVLNADPHELWKSWQSGSARVNTPQLRDGNASRLSPAEVVYYASKENAINPVFTLAKLQGEQGLVQGNYTGQELLNRLELATGYGARIGNQWYGFYPQVVGLTYQFAQFRSQPLGFIDAFMRYTQDARDADGSTFKAIYADFAQRMNAIAGTRFATAPSDDGYYGDFTGITAQHIQTFLQQLGGVLGNAKLFGGGLPQAPAAPQPPATGVMRVDNVTPLAGTVGQTVTFTVTGEGLPPSLVINLVNEECLNDQKPAANQVTCRVTQSGPHDLSVKDKKQGTVLRSFQFQANAAPANGRVVAPVSKPSINQAFGSYLGVYKGIAYKGYHPGTDFAGKLDTEVVAMADGKVVKIGSVFSKPEAGGWYTVIDHPALNVQTLYLHTAKPLVAEEATVTAGQPIAKLMVPTRFPTHLHVEVKRAGKKVVNSKGNPAIFVGKTTTPVGNLGYVRRKADLDEIWLDPEAFIAGAAGVSPVASQATPGTSFVHDYDEQEDDPAEAEQVSRLAALAELAKFAVAKNLAKTASAAEMQRLGVFGGANLSRPTDSASRMEVALMVKRLIEPVRPAVVNPGQHFGIDEFGSTPEADEQAYLDVVNQLYQWGVVNGQQDSKGDWRYYPTRKISRNELDLILKRLNDVIPTQGSGKPPNAAQITRETATPIANLPTAAPPAIAEPSVNPSSVTQTPGQIAESVSISISNPNPRIGETLQVNLSGELPVTPVDIYLYSNNPPAEPGAFVCEPLEAAKRSR